MGPGGAGQPGAGPEQYGPGYPGGDPNGLGQPGPGRYGPGTPGGRRGTRWPGGQPPQEQPQSGGGAGRLGDPPRDGVHPGIRTTGGWDRAGGTVIRQRDSALPDPAPNVKGPIAAIENDNVGAFARDLRVLRSKGGLDYPDMAEKSHYTMRTLASAAGGLRLPTLPVLIAYVKACGGDVAEWEERWGKLIKSGKKGPTALPAAGTNTADDEPGVVADGLPGAAPAGPGEPGQAPPNPPRSGEVYVITSAKPREEHW